MTARRVHFWPAEPSAWRWPGHVLPCRVRGLSGTPASTRELAGVTCSRCRRAVASRQLLDYAPRDGGPWPRELLEAAGLLEPGSAAPSTPVPFTSPYRPPAPRPLEAMGDRWRQRAAVEFSRRDKDPAAARVAQALISCAAELDDYQRVVSGGAW